MGKTKRSKRAGSGNWDKGRHDARLNRKLQKQENSNDNDQEKAEDEDEKDNDPSLQPPSKKRSRKLKSYHRSVHLSHDNYEKMEQTKLRLHTSKVKRDIQGLRERLEDWDEVEEQRRYLNEQASKKKEDEEKRGSGQPQKKKKRGRLGPETWKLRGAARPAWEVYDFDTRYQDPHLKAHEDAKEKAKRIINAFHVCKGYFGFITPENSNENKYGNDGSFIVSDLLCQVCRSFLSLSIQYALLNIEAKKFKSAREIFMEIIEVEGEASQTPFTSARCRLMRLCMEANRPDSARKLWERLPCNYSSVWIRFSAVLLEYVSWNILKEEGSTKDTTGKLLIDAVRANIFCAYYIAFHETFDKVFEYTEDIEDADNGSLEQAIEYCNSEQIGNWIGTEGAVKWIRKAIVQALHASSSVIDDSLLSRDDVEWEGCLVKIEDEYEKDEANRTGVISDDSYDANREESDDKTVDLLMYSGMFRTGMDMLSDIGALT